MPLLIVSIVTVGLIKKVKVFDCFIKGAKKGMMTVYELMPSIVGLVVAVSMFKASGGSELIANLLTPVAKFLNVPQEILPMALLSPISGGGSLSLFEQVLNDHGPDSFIGRVASVLMGSSDTTVYAVTVYFSAIGIKNTRHTLYSGLLADFTSMVLSSFFVRLTI